VLAPAAAVAQGQIAGTVRDSQNAVMPGVTVEVTSPALIEKLRTTATDSNGQYRITNPPVGTYKVAFSLSGLTKQDGVLLTSDFAASVNATIRIP
jgi:Carboxypeptidase regulatory-like domain